VQWGDAIFGGFADVLISGRQNVDFEIED
jgi:hypothetical protein